MSEVNANDATASSGEAGDSGQKASTQVKLNGLFAIKEAMTTVFSESGEAIPVTVLRFDPLVITQIKTKEKDGYAALQIAGQPKKSKNSSKAEKGHFHKSGLEGGARFVQEIRQEIPGDAKVGAVVSIESFAKGDVLRVRGTSKGRGFQGSIRRHNFAGGPAAHGSKFHRRPGSVGNRTWPGRVMPGKKFPGHWGDETITVKNVKVVDVLKDDGVILVKGPVPGARNSLVSLVKE